MGKDEHSWKFRAETAEALLEAEREEVERLRAYIKELEAQLPDEEGGEEPLPEKPKEDSFTSAMLQELYNQMMMQKRQVAAEVSLEVRVNAERMEEEEARVALKLDDGRTFHYAVGHPTIERIRGDARSAGPLIHNITQAFASSMGDKMPMPVETLRGSVGSVIMDLIERKKGRDEYIAF